MSKKYTVKYERDDSGWWYVSVPKIKGCHTQGRTVSEGRRRIREALELWVDNADTCELVDDIVLPATFKTLSVRLTKQREAHRKTEKAKRLTTVRLARWLKEDQGLSVRDAGELMGLSHQAVQKVLRDS